MVVLTPTSDHRDLDKPSIFLAGAIDMGSAVNWQKDVIEA